MCLAINFLQALDTCVRVNLGRGNGCVSEQLLDCTKVRACIEQMSCERVAKRMRGQSRVLVDAIQKSADGALNSASGNAFSSRAEKKCGAIRLVDQIPHEIIALHFVISESDLRMIADRNDPFLSSLSANLYLL